MLKYGDKIGIVCCSNGQKHTYMEKLKCLENTLENIGLHPVFSDCIYEKEDVFSGTAKERAEAFMRFYKDDEIKGIFDISGGDVANGNDLFQINFRFIQQSKMQGIVVGGNIRCFLKLAGTEYMPGLDGKILLLESFGGTVAKIETYLCQLQQMGAFDKVAGIILGTFTEMEQEKCIPTVETLVKRIVGKDMPIAVTRDIGHGTDSKAIVIGQELYIEKQCEKCIEK
ncbi:MAG: LD-carboxypeptidase [Lachnospiraceae bacterium]|nr:LD-carboxypeptidase [Lachnospiraceae bacterium]